MEDDPQKKSPANNEAVQLKHAEVNEDGGDQAFTVEIVDKFGSSEEKEPLKPENLGDGERTRVEPETGLQQTQTTTAVLHQTYKPSLWLAICRAYYKPFVVGAFFKLGHDILMFVSPMLLKYVDATLSFVLTLIGC